MKLLKDLIISRKELQDWNDNLSWARDGSLFLNSLPDITHVQPIYFKDVSGNSKHMFHVRDYSLVLNNKFEYVNSEQNCLLNAQPASFIRQCKPSKCHDGLIAILTSNHNVLLFHGQNLIAELDQPDSTLKTRTYHSAEWSSDGKHILVGNEAGEVVVFQVHKELKSNQYCTSAVVQIKVGDDDSWVIQIKSDDNLAVVGLSDNSVKLIRFTSKDDYSVDEILPKSLFKLHEAVVMNKRIIATTTNRFYCYDLDSKKLGTQNLDPAERHYIITLFKNGNSILLVSNKSIVQIELGSELMTKKDDILAPYLEKKLKRWNELMNEDGSTESYVQIYGLALSPDKFSLAALYSFEKVSLKYRIASENQYRMIFVPLYKDWVISPAASGLAWYQTYNIYNQVLPLTTDSTESKINLNITDGIVDNEYNFKSELNELLLQKWTIDLQFSNFINETQSITKIRRYLYDYACKNKSQIENLLDKACVQSLAAVLSLENPFEANSILFKGEFIEETFNVLDYTDDSSITSVENHTWRRCAVSLLPILTTNVKICPVSNQRVIDIEKDHFNDYGWFTKSLLEVFSEKSIYTGTNMLDAI